MKMLGSKIIMESLLEQGVDTIFGYPGGQIMPLYDALYDYTKSGKIKHILTAHEQGATHAADGYARSKKKPGVVFVTSGPGATNTVTGIATAHMDSIPMVVIAGQVPVSSIGKDAFQEVDIVGITLPIVKHSFALRNTSEIAPAIRDAFIIATSGRPGPVLIDIPKDLTTAEGDYKKADKQFLLNRKKEIETKTQKIDTKKIKEIAELINSAKKPVIYAGGGVSISSASDQLAQLVHKAQIPTSTTLMALGTLPRTDKYSLGMVGMHGSKKANLAFHNSDLIITLGARFSDRVIGNPKTFGKKSKVIHIDIDNSEIDKNIYVDLCLLGDIKEVLVKLLPHIKKANRSEWLSEIDRKAIKTGDYNGLTPNVVFEEIQKYFGKKRSDVIVVTDVGQHQMWTAQKWMFEKPNKLITSGGLGTMGFGMGAAIGAKIANPTKTVILFTGDGSFRMNMNELATVKGEGLDIIVFVLNNSVLGMVRQWQKLFFSKRYSATTLNDVVDYEKLASAFSIYGKDVNSKEELRSELKKVHTKKIPAVFNLRIKKDENVWPMVPPGESIENQVITE